MALIMLPPDVTPAQHKHGNPKMRLQMAIVMTPTGRFA
jgi:hypothetical protein